MKTNTTKNLINAICLTSLILISSAVNAASNKLYHLKGDPMIGSNIPVIEASSPIPFNKRYANLSAGEKKIFKTKFNDLSVTDTPPFPRSGLRVIYRPIIKANKKIDVSGSLHLAAKINKQGFVESVTVLKSPDEKLAAVAKHALLGTRFDPASCNGVACEMTFPLEIKFK